MTRTTAKPPSSINAHCQWRECEGCPRVDASRKQSLHFGGLHRQKREQSETPNSEMFFRTVSHFEIFSFARSRVAASSCTSLVVKAFAIWRDAYPGFTRKVVASIGLSLRSFMVTNGRWIRGLDSNQRPLGNEPSLLPLNYPGIEL
jgi:hypothetical protein